MKITALRLFLFVAVIAIGSLGAFAQSPAAPTKAGQIKAVAIQGEVFRKAADGTTVALHNGDAVRESDVVTTGKNASVVLVFMNASTVKLGAETQLAIEEFKMDPLGQDMDMAAFKDRATDREPSVSKTNLALAYGELVGEVKHLNVAQGSTYNIKTPVGAAGIRGTIYKIVFKPDSTGKAFFQVTTADGTVVVQGLTGQDIPIAAGKEISVTVDIPDPASTGPTTTITVVATDAPTDQLNAVTTESNVIATAVQNTVMNQTPPGNPTPPPESQGPPSSLTPGAGG